MDFLKIIKAQSLMSALFHNFPFTKSCISIKSHNKKVMLIYDGDDAGANAVIKAGWTLLQGDLDPVVIGPLEV